MSRQRPADILTLFLPAPRLVMLWTEGGGPNQNPPFMSGLLDIENSISTLDKSSELRLVSYWGKHSFASTLAKPTKALQQDENCTRVGIAGSHRWSRVYIIWGGGFIVCPPESNGSFHKRPGSTLISSCHCRKVNSESAKLLNNSRDPCQTRMVLTKRQTNKTQTVTRIWIILNTFSETRMTSFPYFHSYMATGEHRSQQCDT